MERLAQEQNERAKALETRRIESSRPFLEKQLQLYSELVSVASKICTHKNEDSRQPSIERFWELYWGEIGLIDNSDVQQALESFGQAVAYKTNDFSSLRQRCVELTVACRKSLAKSWATNIWLEPDRVIAPQADVPAFGKPVA